MKIKLLKLSTNRVLFGKYGDSRTELNTKAEIQTAAFSRASNQTRLPIFGGRGERREGRRLFGGLPLQKRLSIGAASVSSPSHQTGA